LLEISTAGARDRKLRFYAVVPVQSARGSMTPTKATLIAAPWGKVNYGTGAERREAGAEESLSTATARVPANSRTLAIDANAICELDGATWDVTSNVPWGRRERDITLVRRET
jgi:head-tail adaptor